MLPFRRLRGAVTRRGAGSAAASTGAHSGDDNTLPPATALQQPRQRRLQCQLLLHLAWLAMLLSTTAASLVARKERHLQLARELLAASGGSSDGVAGGVAGSGAGAVGSDADDLQQCAEALQLPQVSRLVGCCRPAYALMSSSTLHSIAPTQTANPNTPPALFGTVPLRPGGAPVPSQGPNAS